MVHEEVGMLWIASYVCGSSEVIRGVFASDEGDVRALRSDFRF